MIAEKLLNTVEENEVLKEAYALERALGTIKPIENKLLQRWNPMNKKALQRELCALIHEWLNSMNPFKESAQWKLTLFLKAINLESLNFEEKLSQGFYQGKSLRAAILDMARDPDKSDPYQMLLIKENQTWEPIPRSNAEVTPVNSFDDNSPEVDFQLRLNHLTQQFGDPLLGEKISDSSSEIAPGIQEKSTTYLNLQKTEKGGKCVISSEKNELREEVDLFEEKKQKNKKKKT